MPHGKKQQRKKGVSRAQASKAPEYAKQTKNMHSIIMNETHRLII